MAISPEMCLALWEQAAESEFGLAITTDDRSFMQGILYNARKLYGDERHFACALANPPNQGEIWIVRKDVEIDV